MWLRVAGEPNEDEMLATAVHQVIIKGRRELNAISFQSKPKN
jgi:hypothetical protein